MLLSDVSIKRPVFASVIGLLLIAIGAVSFTRLSLREYPDIDPPIVSVRTTYQGASANVVESRITEVIEDRISGVEGIRFINSSSQDGQSNIAIEFDISRSMDSAANDVRDRVGGILRMLPEEADPPDVQKADASEEIVLWLQLQSDKRTALELTDYVERYLIDRFSSIDGVARVQIGGQRTPAMRVWLDRRAIAARGLTVGDIERAVRTENVETPAGSLTSQDLIFTARIDRPFRTPEEFQQLVVAKGTDGVVVRLGDVGRVEFGAEEDRSIFRGNGRDTVGIGIVKQSTANVVEVAKIARERAAEVGATLPEDMTLQVNFDGSVFVNAAINEVFLTLAIAVALVVGVIFVFLGSFRATLIPAVTVPISLIASFTVLMALGLSINMLTLLALVMAIGLVVDDAIVVLENIHRRMEEEHETPLVAAFRGTRQVGFAVVATTLVLIAVFVPITFMQGQMGRLFSEFAIAIAAAIAFSMLVALTISPMMASKLLKPHAKDAKASGFASFVDRQFARMRGAYGRVYDATVRRPIAITIAFFAILGGSVALFTVIPGEYTPQEDRGSFQIMIAGPEGASFEYMQPFIEQIEGRLLPMINQGEIDRISVRAPGGFGPGSGGFNSGSIQVVLSEWGHRRNGFVIINDINRQLSDIPGVRAFANMSSAFGRGNGKPIQFVIKGPSYETLVDWRNTFIDALNKDNPGIGQIDWDYKETQQQVRVNVDYARASDLGVTVQEIGSTLQTMLGSKRVGTFVQNGEERYVIFEGERTEQATPSDMENIYVRAARTGELIPLSNLVSIDQTADSRRLNRYNRVRAITVDATLNPGVSLGVALDKMEAIARKVLPEEAGIDYKGQSLDYKRAGSSILFVFAFGILVVFLVLAAQFESWIHPFVIMLCVPATVGGGLLGIWLTGNTLNIYTQIGLIMLVGLAAKNGILIVEFANQLRDKGMEFNTALKEAALTRFRPIVMTSLTAIAGAIPLIFSHGAGAETRSAIGVVILFGVATAMLVTLVLVPAAYALLARRTGSPRDVERKLAQEEREAETAALHPAE
ncbi:MAG TPA: efflux RND transporter permease subunit [Hyphomonadaceae bacterium]|nr:efflux RND transporter permease subunit [Hyphomonadaceae bacterium]HPI49132.1 efflux RND transporter permease subunit [Hyphomonadaceae bacterium]